MSVSRSSLDRLPALPERARVERVREAMPAQQPKPARRRAGRRRDVIPATAEAVEHARRLAVKRARLEAQLDALQVERLRALVQLRAAGVSLTECAEILGVAKSRVQQLIKEAAERDITP